MDFKKLPFLGQFAVVAVMAIVLVAVAWTTYPNFTQMAKNNAGLKSRLEGLQTEIRKGQAIEAKLPEFEKEIAELQAKLQDLLLILPTDTEAGDLLRWVKSLADQSNLDLKVWAPGELKKVEFYMEYPVSMNIEGTYHDLGLFFDRISKYSRIINVNHVDLQRLGRADPAKSIKSSFVATTFVYNDREGS